MKSVAYTLGAKEEFSARLFESFFSLSQSNRLFPLIWFQAAPAVFYLSVEFVEDLIVVEDHWADWGFSLQKGFLPIKAVIEK